MKTLPEVDLHHAIAANSHLTHLLPFHTEFDTSDLQE